MPWAGGGEDGQTECGARVSVTGHMALGVQEGVRPGHGALAVPCKVPAECSMLCSAAESHGMQIGQRYVFPWADGLPFAQGKLRQEVRITEATDAFWPHFGWVTPWICQFKEVFLSLPYPEAALAYPVSSTFPAGLPAVPGTSEKLWRWAAGEERHPSSTTRVLKYLGSRLPRKVINTVPRTNILRV